jgi:hypothetical protein
MSHTFYKLPTGSNYGLGIEEGKKQGKWGEKEEEGEGEDLVTLVLFSDKCDTRPIVEQH